MNALFNPRRRESDRARAELIRRLIVSFVGMCAVSVFWALLVFCALSVQP